jgi:hypothetical protein
MEWQMENEPEQVAEYEFSGPNEQGLIRLKMPNVDPKHAGEFYCITLGNDKDAIAEAMCRGLCEHNYGDWT